MGLFDIFSNDKAEEAAQQKIAGLNAGYDQASQLYGTGRDVATNYYNLAAQPFQALFSQAQGGPAMSGYNAYADATGANGAGGYDRARANFQTNPGYQFALNQGLQAVDRGAAGRGMLTSGNTLQAEQTFGNNLANQQWGQYVQGLSPYLNQPKEAADIARNLAGVNMGLGNTLNSSFGNQGNLGFQTQTGIGNAEAAATMNNYNVGNNILGSLFGGLGLGLKAAGGGGLWSSGGIFGGS